MLREHPGQGASLSYSGSWRKGGDWLVHRLSSSWELRDFSPEEQYLELVVSGRVTHATENGVNTGGGRGAPA